MEGEKKEGNYDIDAIRAVLVAEALGREKKRGRDDQDGDGEYEDDGAGMMVRKKKRVKRNNEEAGRSKTDVRLPERAIEAGTKIVRDALERVVVIEGEEG